MEIEIKSINFPGVVHSDIFMHVYAIKHILI